MRNVTATCRELRPYSPSTRSSPSRKGRKVVVRNAACRLSKSFRRQPPASPQTPAARTAKRSPTGWFTSKVERKFDHEPTANCSCRVARLVCARLVVAELIPPSEPLPKSTALGPRPKS